MRGRWCLTVTAILLSFPSPALAQHLWWNTEGQHDATCLYGQITVLATSRGIYYCGANWHPGKPAGGYCGTQDLRAGERWTIFSIWDTADNLPTKVLGANSKTVFGRFGGEGTGGHTHRIWQWEIGRPFEYFLQKRPGRKAGTTDTRFFAYDAAKNKWQYVSTITSPNAGHANVATFDSLTSFLENFLGQDRATAKVALYRIWVGKTPEKMESLTRAVGDGTWGVLDDAYFLAEGDKSNLDKFFAAANSNHGKPIYGKEGQALAPIKKRSLPNDVVTALKSLPSNELPKELLVSPPGYVTPERRRMNLIKNGSFESADLASWHRATWSNNGSIRVVKDQAKQGKHAILLHASQSDDTRFIHNVVVKPNTTYLLSCWIKTKDVTITQKGGNIAANLSIRDGESSISMDGTKDWTYVYRTLDSGNRTEIEVHARLGKEGNTATGSAWFDDIVLIEIPDDSCILVP